MKVMLAKSAGFCYGVRRAVELAEQTAGDGEPCVMLGSIIHNQDVIGRLEERGLKVVQRPDEVPAGCRVIIRSHGESRAVYKALQARNARILDATCPNVKRIHEIVSHAEEQGRQVPEDYSLVCFDYSGDGWEEEGITCSIHQGYKIGCQVAGRLMKMISRRDCDDRDYSLVMHPEIYVGSSIRELSPKAP